jgi:hypothetical protein
MFYSTLLWEYTDILEFPYFTSISVKTSNATDFILYLEKIKYIATTRYMNIFLWIM